MKILSFFAFILFFTCCRTERTEIAIIPQPDKLEIRPGKFRITKKTIIANLTGDAAFRSVTTYLADRFRRVAGYDLQQKESRNDTTAIVFRKVDGMGKEAYKLSVTGKNIIIESTAPNGAFYAVQTLFQLLPAAIFSDKKSACTWEVPGVVIEDAPAFSYRGLHLDVCSHFFDTAFIKRYLDLMAMHKMNVFHWHLTEDQGWRIEIKKYPELTRKGSVRKETIIGTLASGIYDETPYGGYYTQEQIREIVRYAAERFITVLPEIEMPGHALAAISCFPELSCGLEENYEVATRWGVFRQVYCTKEKTFSFLEDVLTEVMELFPSELIHIGGDECPKTSWKKCPHCQQRIKSSGLQNEFELQSYFICRIEKFINSKGRNIIGWDEILQGGLAPNASVMSWLGEEGGIKAARQGHYAVMAPHTKYYLDYYQADPDEEALCMGHRVSLKEVYTYNPLPAVLSPQELSFIKGVEGCVWTEYMATPQRVEYMVYPRAAAISETAWSHPANKQWEHFVSRLEKHFERLDCAGVHYCKKMYDVQIEITEDGPYSKIVTLHSDIPGTTVHYTLDGSLPHRDSPVYSKPFVIKKSDIIKAIAYRHGKPAGNIAVKKYNEPYINKIKINTQP